MERTAPITATPVAGFVVLAASWLLAGCDMPTALDLSVSIENPWLTELHIELQVSGAGDTLGVTAVPDDGGYAPSDEVRARVEITTEQGDVEELLLRPRVCSLDDGTRYVCGQFVVMMDDGHWVTELEPYLHEIAGTLHLPMIIRDYPPPRDTIYLTPDWGTIEIARGDIEPAMERARSWPHVRFVEAAVLGQVGAEFPDWANEWRGSIPCVHAGPTPHDGILQALTGDSVRVEYRQPDGSVLRATQPMPRARSPAASSNVRGSRAVHVRQTTRLATELGTVPPDSGRRLVNQAGGRPPGRRPNSLPADGHPVQPPGRSLHPSGS